MDFKRSLTFLEINSDLQRTVKYFGHNPNCWMIVIDDTIYYQPYTFGSNLRINKNYPEEHSTHIIGGEFPVFKIIMNEDHPNETGAILLDHFRKLWLTSNVDYHNMLYRYQDKHEIIKNIFQKRRPWFNHVFGALYVRVNCDPNKDRRAFPRCCAGNIPKLNVKINGCERGEGIVENHCKIGILFSIKCEEDIKVTKGDQIQITSKEADKPSSAAIVNLIEESQGFIVKHVSTEKDKLYIGVAPATRYRQKK
ncbi:MAG: hypothetical protein HUN04_12375 [Desulfobacter sp.]|nr:MAG: hypothetical protein HUN04_12375 [Desulfobacter sp.]